MANEQDRYIEQRKKRLYTEGFLPQEIFYYSKVPISTPGMRTIRRIRQKELKRARESKIKNFYKYIKDSYKAQGFTDKQGRIKPELWHEKVFDEVMKPSKERVLLALPADRYELFQKLKMFTPPEAAEIVGQITHTEWGIRRKEFNYLIDNHFSPSEAGKIVYARDPKGKLQPLDLKSNAWQAVIKERLKWWQAINSTARRKGLNAVQAFKYAMREIENYYRRDPKRTPWDNMKLVSPSGPKKPKVDFIGGMQRRRDRLIRQRKERMPYRVS